MSTSFDRFIRQLRSGNITQTDRAAQLLELLAKRANQDHRDHLKKGYKLWEAYATVRAEDIDRILNVEVLDEDEKPSGD